MKNLSQNITFKVKFELRGVFFLLNTKVHFSWDEDWSTVSLYYKKMAWKISSPFNKNRLISNFRPCYVVEYHTTGHLIELITIYLSRYMHPSITEFSLLNNITPAALLKHTLVGAVTRDHTHLCVLKWLLWSRRSCNVHTLWNYLILWTLKPTYFCFSINKYKHKLNMVAGLSVWHIWTAFWQKNVAFLSLPATTTTGPGHSFQLLPSIQSCFCKKHSQADSYIHGSWLRHSTYWNGSLYSALKLLHDTF